MTHLAAQETVVFCECLIRHYMAFGPQMSYYRGLSKKKKKGQFQCELVVLYTHRRYVSMKEHSYQRNVFTMLYDLELENKLR